MSHREDLYKILDLDKKASYEDIKRAFRRLSLLNHPDKNANDPSKTEKFKQITKAYEILGNENKRNQYDNQEYLPIFGEEGMGDFMRFAGMPAFTQVYRFAGNNVHSSSSNSSNMGQGMGQRVGQGMEMEQDDLLNMFFGGENLFNRTKREKKIEKPDPITINLEIQIKEAFIGCSLPLEIERWIIDNNSCRNEKKKIYVDIPKGIDNNELIILKDKGNITEKNTKGDVKLFIKINNDTEFIREGLNLIYKKTLSLKETFCGYEFDIKYIDGRIFKIVNDKGNTSLLMNFKKVIPKLGIERDGNRGDLILEFNTNNLEQFTQEQLDKIKEIL